MATLVPFSSTLLGCGGGGGGGGDQSTSPTLTFQVFSSSYFSPGRSDSYSLNGSDSEGIEYSATISAQTKDETVFEGFDSVPIEDLLVFTENSTGATFTENSTTYYSTTSPRELLGVVSNVASTTFVPVSTAVFPTSAKVGDFGVIGTLIDNDGNTSVESWRLKSTSSTDRAEFVLTTVQKDFLGNVISTGDTTFEIDENGERYRVTIKLTDFEIGSTLNLSGS